MLDPVTDFRAFGIVETIQSAYQITGDTANSLERKICIFGTSAFGTRVVDDAIVAARRVPVHRVVDGTVTYAAFLHAANDGFEGGEILGWVAVQFDIGDVSGICVGLPGNDRGN